MKTEKEISDKLDEALKQMKQAAQGSESRVRAALIVRCLAWALNEAKSDPLLKNLDA